MDPFMFFKRNTFMEGLAVRVIASYNRSGNRSLVQWDMLNLHSHTHLKLGQQPQILYPAVCKRWSSVAAILRLLKPSPTATTGRSGITCDASALRWSRTRSCARWREAFYKADPARLRRVSTVCAAPGCSSEPRRKMSGRGVNCTRLTSKRGCAEC